MTENTLRAAEVRNEFPILARQINGRPLVYLDNAATTQKPQAVIDALTYYYTHTNSNVHRGVHSLSQEATTAFEKAREKVKSFLNAAESREIIFTRGTTEAVNLVASTFGRQFIGEGDEILITAMEHHSNIVPWQILCGEKKAILKVAAVKDNGETDMEDLKSKLGSRTKLVSVCHASNALGTVNPVEEITRLAHEAGAKVLIDGAQAAAHLPVDVQAIGCDFYAISGHKMYGPTGIGALYGRAEILESLGPWHGGGEMIKTVTFERSTYNDIPFRFEAGTPDISGAIGLGAAIDFILGLGRETIFRYEEELLAYAMEKLSAIDGMRFIGTAKQKVPVISFLPGDIHPYDAGVILDQMGVAVRTGHHCTQPLMARFGIPGTCRASFAVYNNHEDVDRLCEALLRAKQMLS